MRYSLCSTVTDGERRVLGLLQDVGSATRSEIVAGAELPPGEAEHCLDTLWASGFVGCAMTYFVADAGAADDWRYSIYPRGRAALERNWLDART